ncbi:Os06g0619700 [Oryza sativa Japonica Group]|uniref:Os06g0619700 protein n=1 Tax=Oryza sativa subsp. japonica TaxID=39947 RepID=A0A0P0WYT3_ORYSJ|nr:Os06g0619700 [Oryza sativa Japonica Group]
MGEDGWSGGSLGTASRMSKGRKDNDGGGDSVSAGQFPPRRLHPHLPPAAAVFVFCSFLTLDGSLIRVASSSSASPPLLTSNSPSLCPYGPATNAPPRLHPPISSAGRPLMGHTASRTSCSLPTLGARRQGRP